VTILSDEPIATWTADDGRNEPRHASPRQSVNVTIQTQRVVPSRTPNGTNQLSSVAVKVTIERRNP
jgi:hypothetical protein